MSENQDLFVPRNNLLFQPSPPTPGQRRFLQQVAEPQGGIQSCYPTSILNGWIQTGALSFEEAQQSQDHLINHHRDWFGETAIEGIPMRTFSRNPGYLQLLVWEALRKEVSLEAIHLGRLPYPTEFIVNTLALQEALVVGSSVHALLAAEHTPNRLIKLIDPLTPNSPLLYNPTAVTEMVLRSGNTHVIVTKHP